MENFKTGEPKSEISLDLSLRCSDSFAASSERKDIRTTDGIDSPRGAGDAYVNSEASESIPHKDRMTREMSTSAPSQRSTSKIRSRKEFEDAIPSNPQQGSRLLSCGYCHREFFNSQALGGHQNAHKHERRTAATRRTRWIVDSQQPKYSYSETPYPVSISSDSGLVADNSIIVFSDKEQRSDANEIQRKGSVLGHGFGGARYWGSLTGSLSYVLQRRTPFSEEATRLWLANLSRLGYERSVEHHWNCGNKSDIGCTEEGVDDGLILNKLQKRVVFRDVKPRLPPVDDEQENSKLDLSLRL